MESRLVGSPRGFTQGENAAPSERRRWQVETVFSMITRRLGESLAACSTPKQNRAMMLKVITHNLMIVLQA